MLHTRLSTIATAVTDGTSRAWISARPLYWSVRLPALLATLLYVALLSFSPAAAQEDENYKVAQGLGVYLGVLPAGMVATEPRRPSKPNLLEIHHVNHP